MQNILSIDLEDYFHPTEVQAYASRESWPNLPGRVQTATRRVLEILARRSVQATFFVLGWVARRHPSLIREIAAAGHEIACHSHTHRLVFELTPEQFRADTLAARAAIEDAWGRPAAAYRAPSYSVTTASLWALEVLVECGFTHDSSIYPIRHDRYGIPGFGRHAQVLSTPSGPILEVPAATVRLAGGRVAPVGGGAYLRLLPYRYTAAGIRRLNHLEAQPACLYLHPWEFDPETPRLASGLVARLRSYRGLESMPAKLDRLLRDFRFAPLTAVHPFER